MFYSILQHLTLLMMMLSTLFLVLTLVYFVETCLINCICEVTEMLYSLKSCSDKISLDYTDYLVIDGKTV